MNTNPSQQATFLQEKAPKKSCPGSIVIVANIPAIISIGRQLRSSMNSDISSDARLRLWSIPSGLLPVPRTPSAVSSVSPRTDSYFTKIPVQGRAVCQFDHARLGLTLRDGPIFGLLFWDRNGRNNPRARLNPPREGSRAFARGGDLSARLVRTRSCRRPLCKE
jgi:hypothetical protein